MSCSCGVSQILLLAICVIGYAHSVVAATHYREDFAADGGDMLLDVDWDDAYIGGNGNTAGVAANDAGDNYLWWYNASGLAANSTTTAAVTTTEFPPTSASNPDLVIRWEQRLENQEDDSDQDTIGTPVDVRLVVQVGDKWYASKAVYVTTPGGVTNNGPWDVRQLDFVPAADQWLELTLRNGEVTLGGAPTNDLSGDLTGIGFVATFAQRQCVNFHFVEIAGVPDIAQSPTTKPMVEEKSPATDAKASK